MAVTIALGLAFIAAYAFYVLDRLPQAQAISRSELWQARPGEALRLRGAPAGRFLDFGLAEVGSIALSIAGRSTILASPAEDRPAHTVPAGLDLKLFNGEGDDSEVAIRLMPVKRGGRAGLMITPSFPHRDLLSLALRSEDAAMILDLGIITGARSAGASLIRAGDLELETATIEIPQGTDVIIQIPTKLLARLGKGVGEYGGYRDRRLDLESVEIESAGTGLLRALACGGARDAILWRRLVPGIDPSDCVRGHLKAIGLSLEYGFALALEGDGFTIRDGATNRWPGFRLLRDNVWGETVLSAFLGALLAWMTYIFRQTPFVRFLRRSIRRVVG